MKVSADVETIVDKALAGGGLNHDELVRLCGVDEFSLDAHYILWAARSLLNRACDGVAEVHAQIGMDANPCSKNCLFCSFAACNTTRSGTMEMPIEQIIRHAKSYVEQGANCLTLMITADYDFGKYVEYVARVREAIGPDMPITANTDDFGPAEAKRLKQAGVGSIYHAVRMGEGVINDIPMERRFETIAAAQEEGLKVMTCLEMIDPRYMDDEIVTNMERVAAANTDYASAWGMIAVPGTKLYDDPHYNHVKYGVYSAIMRLACGDRVRFGGGNLSWAEVGTNPRDASNETEKDGLGQSVHAVREALENKGWKTFRGPSPWW